MFIPFFDPTMILLIPALILALWAQSRVKSAFKQYSKIANGSRLTGAQVARRILDRYALQDVEVEAVSGMLSDHYDPLKRVVRLSESNFSQPSLAGLAVAAHECGHAIQHSEGYSALRFRHSLARPVQFGSWAAFPLFFLGLIFSSPGMMDIGIVLFSLAVLFHMVTLPVEFDASKRAIAILNTDGYLTPNEVKGAKKVLDAAAWTYVAAATMAVLQLLRLLLLRGMIGDD
ncbi:MAG: zinc metallopeptidase [Candidatus Electryonea clarkiae]|nr:zinc metallopeptidase [Candidatus Electryonea clarkiae]MDP8287070.1 zinc metallopeptidase [Candidatus Electryonea clarkiae]